MRKSWTSHPLTRILSRRILRHHEVESLFWAVALLAEGARVGLPCAIVVDDNPGPVVCPGGMAVGHPRLPVVVQGRSRLANLL